MDFTQARHLRAHRSLVPLVHPLGAVRSWNAARLRRRDADRRIAGGSPVQSDLAWRAAELTSDRERELLARSLRDVHDELTGATLPGASPLNRPAVRPHAAGLAALTDRLLDLERPVEASGILAVHRLLTEPDSVLFVRPALGEPAPDIGAELGAILDRLEVRP